MAQTSDTTTQGPLLKELYTLPPVRVINDKSYLHDTIQKDTPELSFSGEHIRWPVTVQRSLGRGSRGEGGELPVAISEVDLDATANIAHHYHTLEWTEVLEEVSKSKEGAFESAVGRKMKNLSTDLAKDLNRQFYNADANGTLATIPTGATNATQTVDSVQFLHVGEVVDVYNGGSLVASKTVSSINDSAKTVTFDSSITLTGVSNATIHITGSRGFEIEGLLGFAAVDRVLHGIDSTTYEQWDGNVLDAASAVAGESLFEQLSDNIGERGRGEMDDYLTTRGIRRRLADEFATQRRWLNEKTMAVGLGYRSIEVNGHNCVIDDDCPKGNVLAYKRDALRLMQLTKPGFMESEAGNGAKVELKNSTNAGRKMAVWQAYYRYHVNLVCVDPGLTGRIKNAQDDAPKHAV